ncbi:uncharacterized protein G2W53_002405 [Senna tora]|uniref:Uncharacterized protein n=1 Tax=Senna tora TaxID=362788 RepID=A0A834XHB3_9FABA|nr:uncharacterized protein G2W53_002405 [Senna tora]
MSVLASLPVAAATSSPAMMEPTPPSLDELIVVAVEENSEGDKPAGL